MSSFVGKVKGKHDSAGITLETMIEGMDEAGIDVAFLVAAKAGRVGLPGCYHMPLEVVSRAVEQYPDRFRGMLGLDPYMGMDGVRQLETAVKDFGFIGAHLYPHWFELPPNNAKYYPFYAKCIELDIPVQMQVGQSLIYAKEHPCRSVGRPIYLDDIACDLPELKLLGTHVGIPWHDEMIAMSWKHENVFIVTDAHSPKYWPDSVKHYINSYGQNKVIFGTDFPVLRFKRTVDEVDEFGLKPEVRRKVHARQRHSCIRLGGLVITAPLDGIRVVEMTSVVLGPYACQMLGDLGADIIKIEPLAGDTNRNLGPHANDPKMSALFLTCNRNKRSVALDLKSDAGREAALKLIETADVVVHNFRPQAMESAWPRLRAGEGGQPHRGLLRDLWLQQKRALWR